MRCDLKIGVDCALTTCSRVELAVSKNSELPIPSDIKGLGMPDAQGQCQAVTVDYQGTRYA